MRKPKPGKVACRMLLDANGEAFAAGTVLREPDRAYVVAADGSFRRVVVVGEGEQFGTVRFLRGKKRTKAERKAAKRALHGRG